MGSEVLLHLLLYGGEIWLKLLVTLDDIPEHAAESYNDLCMVRAMEKRNKAPGEFADFTPDGAYLSRADRASTPVPFEYVRPGVRRQRAKAHLDTLFDMMRKGTKVDQVWVDAAKKEMEEAEAASLSSLHEFTSYWTRQRQNVRPACSRWCSRAPSARSLSRSSRSSRITRASERARTRAVLRRPLRAREGGGKGGRGGSGGGFHHGWRPGKGMHYQ